MKLKRYNKNLKVEGNKVISYNTHVATIEDSKLIQLGYWSRTTQKHINYVARELNLTLSKQDQKEKESDPILNSMKAFLLLGDLMNDKKEDKADAVKYKERIVFATMRSMIPQWEPPADWSTITDEQKLERLTKIETEI